MGQLKTKQKKTLYYAENCLKCSTHHLFEDYEIPEISSTSQSIKFKAKVKDCISKDIRSFIKIFFYDENIEFKNFDFQNVSELISKFDDYRSFILKYYAKLNPVEKELFNGLKDKYQKETYSDILDLLKNMKGSYLELLNMKKLNELIDNDKTPHVVRLLDYVECNLDEFNFDDFHREIKVELSYLKDLLDIKLPRHNIKIYIVVMEDILYKEKELSLYEFISKNITTALKYEQKKDNWVSKYCLKNINDIVFQYLYTLNVFKKNKFQHNDNHVNNFIMEDQKVIKRFYNDENQWFKCKSNFIGKFIDFDRSMFFDDDEPYQKVAQEVLSSYEYYYKERYLYVDYFMFLLDIYEIIENKDYDVLEKFSDFKNLRKLCYQANRLTNISKLIRKKIYNIPIFKTERDEKQYIQFVKFVRNEICSYKNKFFDEYRTSKPKEKTHVYRNI